MTKPILLFDNKTYAFGSSFSTSVCLIEIMKVLPLYEIDFQTCFSFPQGTGNLIGRALDEITAEGEKVSSVIEKLILAIELNGLYTVGLYRKAGAAGITRKLLNSLDHESEWLGSKC